MDSRRQQQVSGVIQETLSEIFQKSGSNFFGNSFVTITNVRVTPDLLVARVNVSVFHEHERQGVLAALKQHTAEIRKLLGNRVKNQLRRVPELEFYIDDSLDKVFKIEKLLKEIKDQREDNKT
jgi:ribosome-binding factor A